VKWCAGLKPRATAGERKGTGGNGKFCAKSPEGRMRGESLALERQRRRRPAEAALFGQSGNPQNEDFTPAAGCNFDPDYSVASQK